MIKFDENPHPGSKLILIIFAVNTENFGNVRRALVVFFSLLRVRKRKREREKVMSTLRPGLIVKNDVDIMNRGPAIWEKGHREPFESCCFLHTEKWKGIPVGQVIRKTPSCRQTAPETTTGAAHVACQTPGVLLRLPVSQRSRTALNAYQRFSHLFFFFSFFFFMMAIAGKSTCETCRNRQPPSRASRTPACCQYCPA